MNIKLLHIKFKNKSTKCKMLGNLFNKHTFIANKRKSNVCDSNVFLCTDKHIIGKFP